MKLSLTVEADAINVLALNMGRIAADIDGIELAELMTEISQSGCPLRMANAPETVIQENSLPPDTTLHSICCSTAHITRQDNAILDRVTLQRHDGGNSDWILYTGYGYLLRLNARIYPVLALKRLGLSKACRRLVTTLIKSHGVSLLHVDASGALLPGFDTFDE
ncbi:hypothetical protein FDX06_14265 [Citrobacter sp. wls618]|uniref:DUF5983 family protein n=1 Tax=Citrobacter TaxID=544 RepID=UPI0010C9AC2B|nr:MULTISPECIES: DUF5983 family protein [Citrobacter]MDH1757433.1 DUF5983 family protein [Citrobacter braakii]MDH1855795.1 DUF5983 family protein [Citrobacter braakii]TKU32831.1 hypothetical protein FDW99_03545 [Citrobacter sp. wls758]TKV03044.1 hypothetical protein FDX06_14265 [Citrobacter sp. wls618]